MRVLALNIAMNEMRQWLTVLHEIDIGGEVDSSELERLKTQDFTPKQLTLLPNVPAEPTLPKDMELVGRIGPYFVTRKQERKGEFIYYLFDSGTPIAYVATIPPDAEFGEGWPGRKHQNPDLDGKGLRVVSIYLDPEVRGKGLSVALYEWLLSNVCDYILPDDLQTRGGVYIWKQMLRDPRFEIMVFNFQSQDYYKPKPGAVWANTYRSPWLRPFVTLAGKAEELLPE